MLRKFGSTSATSSREYTCNSDPLIVCHLGCLAEYPSCTGGWRRGYEMDRSEVSIDATSSHYYMPASS